MSLNSQHWLSENAALVLDAVVDAIITIDARGFIQSHNSATQQMFGYGPTELIGRPITSLMPQPYKSEHQSYIERYLQTQQARIIGLGRELTAEKSNGDIFPIYLAVNEIPDEKGYVGIIRDLSKQKAAEQALSEQKEKVAQVGRLTTMGEMTASIAHEINQPLTAISMYAHACLRMLAKPDHDPGKILEAIEKLNAQSLRAGDVIERIQRFVQHSTGEKSVQDINLLLGDIRTLAAGDARLHGMNLRLDLEEGSVPVYCDAVQIQQVALNLVRNAVDAMYEIDCVHGNTITVRSELLDKNVYVGVSDLGPGVNPIEEGKIFQPFHTTKADGMGMGLSICQTIIEDHGGKLAFGNNANFGATFYVHLPIGETHA